MRRGRMAAADRRNGLYAGDGVTPLPRIFYIFTEVIILRGKMLVIPLFTLLFTLLTVPPPLNM